MENEWKIGEILPKIAVLSCRGVLEMDENFLSGQLNPSCVPTGPKPYLQVKNKGFFWQLEGVNIWGSEVANLCF